MKSIHWLQAILGGIISCGMTLAVVLPAPYSHYVMVGIVGLVAFLTPLGIISPSAMQPNTQALAMLQQTTTTTATAPATPAATPPVVKS